MADITKLIKALKDESVDDKSIAEFVSGLQRALSQRVEHEIAAALSEDDFARLNRMDEAQAHAEISRRYREITGCSIEDVSDNLAGELIEGFLADYESGKPQQNA